jgi:nucleoside-diphosphate-sugar epimerase
LRDTAERLGIELVIVRPALVVGPNAPGNLETLGRLIRSGYPIPVGRPANERSYIGVNDLTQLLVKCLSAPAARGQVLLAADPVRFSTEFVVRQIAAGMGRRPRMLPLPTGMARFAGRLIGRSSVVEKIVGDLRIDPTKAMQTLDWKPSGNLPDEFLALGRSLA